MIWDFVSGDARRAIELILSQQAFTRPYAVAPEVPKERVATLRDAFDKAIASPEMKSEFVAMGSPLAPLSGSKLDTIVSAIFDSPKQIIDIARKAQEASN